MNPQKCQKIPALWKVQFPRQFFQIQGKTLWFPVKSYQWMDFQTQCKMLWFLVKPYQSADFQIQCTLV